MNRELIELIITVLVLCLWSSVCILVICKFYWPMDDE